MVEPTRIQVIVFAAYPAVRAGLVSLLSGDRAIDATVAEPSGVRPSGALPQPPQRAVEPAVIVVDVSGIDEAVLEEIQDAYPNAAAVLIGGEPGIDGPGMADGAIAFLGPEVDGPMLAAAVHGVLAGLTVIDPVYAGAWTRQPAVPDPEDANGIALVGSPDVLTDRERQVLELVASGLPNKAIARVLGISEHTVKFHVGSLLGKLGAGSRTEAVTLATRRGLLTI